MSKDRADQSGGTISSHQKNMGDLVPMSGITLDNDQLDAQIF
jgi:hypothetical protein